MTSTKDIERRKFSNKIQLAVSDNDKFFVFNAEKVISSNSESEIIGTAPSQTYIDGNTRPVKLTDERCKKILQKHGMFSANNMVATINTPDYIIKNIDGKEGRINFIKKLQSFEDYLIVSTQRDNGYFIVTHYEVRTGSRENLERLLERGKVIK